MCAVDRRFLCCSLEYGVYRGQVRTRVCLVEREVAIPADSERVFDSLKPRDADELLLLELREQDVGSFSDFFCLRSRAYRVLTATRSLLTRRRPWDEAFACR